MAPKKFLIKMSIPAALKLSAKEAADLKKGFKMVAVRVVTARGSSSNINVINSGDINVINVHPPIGARKKSASKTKTKAKTKKR